MMSPSVAENCDSPGHPTPPQTSADVGESLSIRVREESTRTFVTPVGDLDFSTAASFDRCMWEAQTRGRQVVLDLRALAFIDSAGLRSLLAASVRATEAERRLQVICAHGEVRRMLSLSGLDGLIETIEPLTPLQEFQARGAVA
jgi:anti-sigma B factor antagonist